MISVESNTKVRELDLKRAWVLYIDVSTGQQHQGAGFVLQNSDSMDFAYALKYTFTVSNNESEYEALIMVFCHGISSERRVAYYSR